MDTLTKGLLAVGALAGLGIAIAVVVSRQRGGSGYPSTGRALTVAGAPVPEQQQGGIENYSEITWNDALGNERKMVSHRMIREA